MSFQSPLYFWLFIPLLIAFMIVFFLQRKREAALQLGSVAALKALPKTWRTRWKGFPLFLKFMALGFLIVALARPQKSDTQVRKNVEGIDIMIVLDVSDSMLIEDMKPLNRMEAAKQVIKDFVQKRVSDRIGVIVFAGESFTLVPLTLDYQLLVDRISEITTAQQARIKDGTALGVAMANGAGRLRDSTAKSRVMIFLTDGENNSGTIDPLTGLEIAKGYGIKVYSIGLGKDGPTRIPVFQRDVFGNKVKSYQPFESTVNEDLLGKMASETGGKFFRATREDGLARVFQEIDQLEKTKIDVNKFTRYTELYKNYLLWALICYVFAWLLQITLFRRGP
ncbi:MAG: VWA domain-containing protein [Proteobacteria bacterium]|nr:VWA domain-containing protein [Pseudomonadota bacterium]